MGIVPIPLSFGKTPVGDSVFHKIHMTFHVEKAVEIQTKVSCEEQKSLQPPFLPCRGGQQERGQVEHFSSLLYQQSEENC